MFSDEEQAFEVALALEGYRIVHDEPSIFPEYGQWYVGLWYGCSQFYRAWDVDRYHAMQRAYAQAQNPAVPEYP